MLTVTPRVAPKLTQQAASKIDKTEIEIVTCDKYLEQTTVMTNGTGNEDLIRIKAGIERFFLSIEKSFWAILHQPKRKVVN